MNIYETIDKANKTLKQNNIKTSYLDSELLLSKVIKKDRKYIILNSKKILIGSTVAVLVLLIVAFSLF